MNDKENQKQAIPKNRNRSDIPKNDIKEENEDDKSLDFPENHENIINNIKTDQISQKMYKEYEEKLMQNKQEDICFFIIFLLLILVAFLVGLYKKCSSIYPNMV